MKKIIKVVIIMIFLGCQKNFPPAIPSEPSPEDGAVDQPTSLVLKWNCEDPDGDVLTYTLYFGISENPPLKADNISVSEYSISDLDYSTKYYWKVVARDEKGEETEGPVWSFTTTSAPTGFVYVSSSPQGAKIYLDGFYTEKTTNALLENVPVGDHTLLLEKEGYVDAQKRISVIKNETTYVSVNLVRAGCIKVTSSPTGARVFLDEIDTGQETNCILSKVAEGPHSITLHKQGYQEWEKDVTVVPDDTVTINAILIARYGSLQVNSNPEGAEIYIDGEDTGEKTNHTFPNILEGKHEVKLHLDGYQDWIDTVNVYAGKTTAIDAYLKGLGFIQISSEPQGASVYLDGENQGVPTPCVLENIVEGTHQLTLRLIDYRDWTQSVTVVKGETTSVTAIMEHETGSLIVNSNPEGAAIYIDGDSTGYVTDTIIEDLWTGKHAVRLEMEGKFPCEDTVEILVDQTTTFDTTLIPIEVGYYEGASSTYGVDVSGNYVYLANGQEGLWIVDISNVSSPKLVGKFQIDDFVKEVKVKDSKAYIGTWESGLIILDVSNPSSPTILGSCSTPSSVEDICIQDSYAYIADKQGGLRIIDISSDQNPQEVGFYDTDGVGEAVCISGNYVYFGDGSNGLLIFDCSDPTSPSLIGRSQTSLYAIDVEISKNYVFVCDWNSGLAIFDVTDPSSPEKVRSFYSPGNSEDVALMGDYAYLADGITGLRIIDCISPSWPEEAGWQDTPGYAREIVIDGNFAYIADGIKGLRIIRIGWE